MNDNANQAILDEVEACATSAGWEVEDFHVAGTGSWYTRFRRSYSWDDEYEEWLDLEYLTVRIADHMECYGGCDVSISPGELTIRQVCEELRKARGSFPDNNPW